jgi:hypothetical protein
MPAFKKGSLVFDVNPLLQPGDVYVDHLFVYAKSNNELYKLDPQGNEEQLATLSDLEGISGFGADNSLIFSLSGDIQGNSEQILSLLTNINSISGDLAQAINDISTLNSNLDTKLDKDEFASISGSFLTQDNTLGDINDIILTNPTEQQLITYSTSISGWENSNVSDLNYTPSVPLYFYNNQPITKLTDAIDANSREAFYAKHIALQQASTSVNVGGNISISGSDSINIEGGFGFWIDHSTFDSSNINPTYTKVTWPDQTVQVPNINNGVEFSFVYIDATNSNVGFIQSEPTPEDYRNKLLLGKVIHRDGNVNFVVQLKPKSNDIFNQFSDLAHAIGTINIDGNIWTPSDPLVNLTLAKSAGKSFRLNSQVDNLVNPHTTIDPPLDTNGSDTFSYVYRDGSGGVTYINGVSEADPTQYDNGSGILSSIPDGGFFTFNQYTVQRIYSFPKPSSGGGGKSYIFYGQKVYTTLDNALEGILTEKFELPAENFYDASLRGWLIMRRDITNFSNPSYFTFVAAGKFGENAGGTSLSAESKSLFKDDLFRIENNGDPTSFLRFSLQNLLDTGETITINANNTQDGDIELTLPSISGQLALTSELASLNDLVDENRTLIETLSGGGGTSNIESLGDVNDVDITAPLDNYILTYSQSVSGWQSSNILNTIQTQVDDINTIVTEMTTLSGGVTPSQVENIIDDHILKALEKQIKAHSSDSNITYVGEAEPGSVTSAPVWRIKEIVETGDDISIQWADGNGDFDKIFDNRESLTYT